VGWWDLLSHWRLVVADLAAIYGVDLSQPVERRWSVLRDLILSLPAEPGSRVARELGGRS